MKILFDTSVIIAAIVEAHEAHSRCFPWLRRAKSGEIEMVVSCHTLAEVYAVLTSMPVSPKISPAMAMKLIHDNIEATATLVPLSAKDFGHVLKRLEMFGLAGGITYDALIARVAEKADVDKLLTLNIKDFKRVWPEEIGKIILP